MYLSSGTCHFTKNTHTLQTGPHYKSISLKQQRLPSEGTRLKWAIPQWVWGTGWNRVRACVQKPVKSGSLTCHPKLLLMGLHLRFLQGWIMQIVNTLHHRKMSKTPPGATTNTKTQNKAMSGSTFLLSLINRLLFLLVYGEVVRMGKSLSVQFCTSGTCFHVDWLVATS